MTKHKKTRDAVLIQKQITNKISPIKTQLTSEMYKHIYSLKDAVQTQIQITKKKSKMSKHKQPVKKVVWMKSSKFFF